MTIYHSFPRLRKNESPAAPYREAAGCMILEGILKYGMILAHEKLEIPPNPLSTLARPPSDMISQLRACFTLIGREELLKPGGHTASFGEFSIGLDSLEARRLGLMPTIYYYPPTQTGAGSTPEDQAVDGGLSQQILFRLAEVRRLMIALAHVEAAADHPASTVRTLDDLREAGFSLADEPSVSKALAGMSSSEASNVLKYFKTERVSAFNIAEWLEILLSLFQTADSKKRNRTLEYFSQREWRIIQANSRLFHCLPLSPSFDGKLSERRTKFVADCRSHLEEIGRITRVSPEIEKCHVFAGLSDKLFREFITEIIVPSSAEPSVRQMVAHYFPRTAWTSEEILVKQSDKTEKVFVCMVRR